MKKKRTKPHITKLDPPFWAPGPNGKTPVLYQWKVSSTMTSRFSVGETIAKAWAHFNERARRRNYFPRD